MFWIYFKKIMFGLIKKMFIRLLSLCTIKGFSRSLPSNYKEPINEYLQTINRAKLDKHLLI